MRKFFAQSLKELAPERRWNAVSALSRHAGRTEHGSTAFEPVLNLAQPQDGAQRITDRVTDIGSRVQISSLGNVTAEPEDARLTGGTRSLMRRALGLNFGAIKPVRKMGVKPVPGVAKPVAA